MWAGLLSQLKNMGFADIPTRRWCADRVNRSDGVEPVMLATSVHAVKSRDVYPDARDCPSSGKQQTKLLSRVKRHAESYAASLRGSNHVTIRYGCLGLEHAPRTPGMLFLPGWNTTSSGMQFASSGRTTRFASFRNSRHALATLRITSLAR